MKLTKEQIAKLTEMRRILTKTIVRYPAVTGECRRIDNIIVDLLEANASES